MAEKKYAFWEYDEFPFVLSAEITSRPNAEGRVVVKDYGGMRVKPLQIISGKKGKLAVENLKWIEGEYRDATTNLQQHYCNLAIGFAPFLKKCKQTNAFRNEDK